MQAAERLRCIDRLCPIGLLGDILTDEHRGTAKLVREAVAFRFEHVADHHLCALGNQQTRFRCTLAARATADEHNLVLEPRHRVLPDCARRQAHRA